jgi:hypothetical protein
VIQDLETLFATGKGSLKTYPSHVSSIFERISQLHPATRFTIKGKGEDGDSWTHVYVAGVRSVAKVAAKHVSPATRAAIANVVADPNTPTYSPQTQYVVGDGLRHPTLGAGVVSQVQPTKITVQFADGERTLVHARGG